jgi:hypothetical protein
LNFCKIYEQILVFFLLLPLSVSLQRRPPPIVGISTSHQLPPRRSSYATWPPAHPPTARPTLLAPPRADTSRRCPPEPTRAVDHQQLLAARPHASFWLWNAPNELHPSFIPSRAPAFLFSSSLDYFAGASLSTAVSRLRRSSSPTSCSTSTAASHCPFLTRFSSSSRARTAQNATPVISLPATVLFLVEPKFHPFSFLAKSTISTTSPRRSSLTNSPLLQIIAYPFECILVGLQFYCENQILR